MTEPTMRPPHYTLLIRAACLVMILGIALAILGYRDINLLWHWLPHLGIGLMGASSVCAFYLSRSLPNDP